MNAYAPLYATTSAPSLSEQRRLDEARSTKNNKGLKKEKIIGSTGISVNAITKSGGHSDKRRASLTGSLELDGPASPSLTGALQRAQPVAVGGRRPSMSGGTQEQQKARGGAQGATGVSRRPSGVAASIGKRDGRAEEGKGGR